MTIMYHVLMYILVHGTGTDTCTQAYMHARMHTNEIFNALHEDK